VTDNVPPTLQCPGNINTSTSTCSKSINVSDPSVDDNCAVTTLTWAMTGATVASSPASGINTVGNRTFNVGLTTITYTAKDAAGNTVTCSFTVNLTDNINPTVICPANVAANTN